MTDLCGCGRKLTSLCLWKKNESRFDLISFLCLLVVLSFECKINLIIFLFLQEREKEFEESLAQNTERVVRRFTVVMPLCLLLLKLSSVGALTF